MECVRSGSDLYNEMDEYGRENDFSREGCDILYEYLKETAGGSLCVEVDIIGLCCEYAEYTKEELLGAYYIQLERYDVENIEEALDVLSDSYTVAGYDVDRDVYVISM